MNQTRHVALWVTALLALGSTASARTQSATGTIDGHVVDQSGAVLPGVVITLHQPATGAERTVISDETGGFRLPLLPIGVYDLTATLAGFDPKRETDIRLMIGQIVTQRIELRVAGITQTVNVSGSRPLLERSRTHASATVDEIAVQHLPVNGRNFLDAALLTAGVTRDVRAGDLSFAGQRGTLNSLIVDGADNNNTFAGQTLGRTGSGRAPYQFSQDAVQEFQINANAYAAEYGRAGGGVINVVTRSGTNRWHGSLFEFYRDKALNATNAITLQNGLPKSPYHYHQFGGTVGGPLRANRDFFFFNYDGQRNTQPNDVVLSIPSGTPSDLLTLAGIETLRDLSQSWTRRLDQDVVLIKTDHQLTGGSRLTLRYNHQDFTGIGFENGGIQNSFEHSGDSLTRTRTLNASWTSVSRRNLANQLRVQYARDEAAGTANSAAPEAVIRQGGTLVLLIGRNNFSPRATVVDRVQVADTLVWMRGAHTVKTGVDLQFDRIENFFPGFFGGQYLFQSIASYARGRPDGPGEMYRQSFPGDDTTGPYTRPDARDYSVFAQDQWQLSPEVTLNLGLRYDLMQIAAPPVRNPDAHLAAAGIDTSRLDADVNNWGPRLGVAWSPRARQFVVRGGAGLFYGRTPAILPTTTHSQNGVNVVSLTLTGSAVPTYPQQFSQVPVAGAALRPGIYYVDEDFANPRTTQANAAVEWQLGRQTTLALTYLFVDGRQLPRSVDRNLGSLGQRTFTIAGASDTVSYPFFAAADRPFQNFTRVIAHESNAMSRYHGMTVDLHRRFDGSAQLRVAYTLGKVVDTVPDATAVAPGVDDVKFVSNPIDFEADRAVGQNDQPHRLVVSGLFTTDRVARSVAGVSGALARGWWVSGIITAQSGLPYSARVGAVDLNNDGNNLNDLAPGTRRNAFRLPAIVTVDARIARTLPVKGRAQAQIIWEAFNLFNRANINGVDQNYYTVSVPTLTLEPNARFGQPRSSAGERIMQLAARITF
jgi:outer membrane receptor protein involved in Fe transport